MVQKQNPEIFQQSVGLVNRPEITLSGENFLAVIGLLGKDNSFLVDPSVFKIILKTISQDNVGLNKSLTTLELGLCSADDFKNSSNVLLTRMESKAFCLRNIDLKLKGYWNEQTLDYFSFEVHKCINNSETPSATCRSESEIDEILSSYSIQLYFTNNNLDLSSSEHELSPAFAAYSQQVDVNQFKILNIFLAFTELTTDIGFYFPQEQRLSIIQESKMIFDMNSKDTIDKTLFAVNFFSDNCKNIIIRKYQKIQDFLSTLMGVLHIVAFFGYYFAKLENRLNFIICVTNELFIFKRKSSDQQQSITKSINTTIPPIKLFDTNPSPELPLRFPPTIQISKPRDNLEMSQMAARNKQKISLQSPESKKYEEFEPVPEELKEGIENISELNCSKDISTLYIKTPELGKDASPMNDIRKADKQPITETKLMRKTWHDGLKNLINGKWRSLNISQKNTHIQKNLQCYLKMKRKESRFDLGRFGYLRLLLKHKKWKLTETEQLYMNGEKQVLNELDAVSILRKLQDVEKLKKVLLTQNQLYFFDLLSRPMIKLQDKERKFSVEDGEGERFIIEERYWKLREKARSSEVDERILKMLDEDVYSFMENFEGI